MGKETELIKAGEDAVVLLYNAKIALSDAQQTITRLINHIASLSSKPKYDPWLNLADKLKMTVYEIEIDSDAISKLLKRMDHLHEFTLSGVVHYAINECGIYQTIKRWNRDEWFACRVIDRLLQKLKRIEAVEYVKSIRKYRWLGYIPDPK